MPKLKLYQWVLLLVLWGAGVVIAIKYEVDFPVFYRAVQVSRFNPAQAYSDDLMSQNGPRFYYGPLVLAIARPIVWFDFKVAKYLWILFQSIAFWVFWRFLFAHFAVLQKNKWAWLFVFASSINPIHLNFQSNNIQLMILASLMVAEKLSNKESKAKQILAGMIIPILGCIKVFPWFVVGYYLVGKNQRVRFGLVLGFLVALVFPLLFFGWTSGLAAYQAFFVSLGKYQQHNSFIESTNLQCLHSLIARFVPTSMFEGPWFSVLANGMFGTIGIVLFFNVWRSRREITDPVFQSALWALVVALMIFLNPSSLGHYLVFLVPGLAAGLDILDRIPGSIFDKFCIWGGALIIMVVVDGMIGRSTSHALQKMRVPAMGMLLLCIGLCWIVYRFGQVEKHSERRRVPPRSF